MAVLNSYALTLADILARRTPDGKFDNNILDLFIQSNPILDSIPYIECNGGFTHTTTMRVGTHIPSWVALGEGVSPDKTSYNQIKASCGRLKSLVEIDGDTYDESLSANGKATDATKALVQDEIQAAANGMKDEMAHAYFFGNLAVEPRSFNGINSVFKKFGHNGLLNAGVDKNDAAFYCVNGGEGSATDLRSIYYINWGTNGIHGIYPGSTSGAALKMEPLTKSTRTDDDGKVRNVYNAFLHWNSGICVRDYRTSGRIANLSVSTMLGETQRPQKYLELMDFFSMLPKQDGMGKGEFVMAPSVWRALRTLYGRCTRDNAIEYKDLEQRKDVPTLYGRRVQLCDALEIDEEAIGCAVETP